jgi:hypothetical protein
MQELDGGLMILDIAYSTDGLVYDVRWWCRYDRKKSAPEALRSIRRPGWRDQKQNVRYPAIFKMSSGSLLAISIGVERTSSWSCRK